MNLGIVGGVVRLIVNAIRIGRHRHSTWRTPTPELGSVPPWAGTR